MSKPGCVYVGCVYVAAALRRTVARGGFVERV